ncbi:peptide ABC transporter substrate-binding protein [Cohnella kolymensis]|uniref:Peptide ABC transporter substrate-binding protein n=1 Tax=Cohnella kolymensis TaxID=1590652 RepID=A0ABR5A866_9BACL|nr:peptide ABC transporter substrate-binding protein [Cohnella kolymensis]KIL37245.1 peptide ABC transporter substrate-binding protein [Cohnella kolymensis]
MKFKKFTSTALVLTLAGSLLAACSGNNSGSNASESAGNSSAPASGSASAKPTGPQELVINYRTDPPALDVSIAESSSSFTILGAISEGLYRLDKDLQPQPALAAELPQISPDGLTYTVKLRDGITWADGTPVTAQDFVYSFRRTLDPATKATYAFMVAWIKGGEAVMTAKTPEDVKKAQEALGAKALDEKTLEIKLERPVAFFTSTLAFLNFYPQKQEFVDKWGNEKSGADADKVLGAGPFVLKTWDHGQKLVLEKNPKYWDAANVKLDKVTLNVVKDNATGLNLYDTGAADYTVLDGTQYMQLKDNKELVRKKELVTGYVNFQHTKVPAFKNVKIRQAYTAAIDRQGLVDTVLQGNTAAVGYTPSGNLDGNGQEFRKVAGDLEQPFDAAKAKELLAQGLAEAGLKEMPELTIIGDDNGTGPKVLEFLAGQWEQNLGVKVKTSPMPHANRLELELNKNYEIVSTLWGADYNDPMTWLDMYLTGGSFNTQDWSSAEYDKLVKGAQSDTNLENRAKSLVEAEKILMNEAAVSPLYYRTLNIMVKPKVKGLIQPPYGVEFELKWTSIEE